MQVKSSADLAAYDKNGRLALVVEIKSRQHTSADWAARMRGNLFAHGIMPKSEYFMLAMPDNLYLWHEKGVDSENSEPDFIINTKPLFQRYLDPAIVDASSISGKSLEILVGSWINDLIARGLPDDLPEPQRSLITASGLIDAIQGGYVTQEEFA
jgi:hypothetical protein